MKYSTTEELALNRLHNEFGPISKAMPEDKINAYLLRAQVEFNYQTTEFYSHPCTVNYNQLVNAMVVLQYWSHKEILE